jgi:AcrR family transcriptional regulator
MGSQMIKGIPKRKTREEILELSVPLFAQHGYDGVSMRDVAAVVGLTQAALYYYFSDKDQLYLEAIGYAFEEKMGPLKALLEGRGNPWDRLESFVVQFTCMLAKEENFRRLIQWVLLDSDEQRLQSLADQVFRDLFNALRNLAGEVAPGHDPQPLVISVIGLVIYPFETQSVRRFLPGYQLQHEDPKAIARHVVGLMRNGLGINNERKSHKCPAQGKRAEQTPLLPDCKEKK